MGNNRYLTSEEIHERLLYMTMQFHKFCEENKLTYFLIAGSLLGAVRHKGFIPWDDDVDIAMPREDYEILKSFKNITDDLEIVSYENNHGHYHPFAYINIADTKTLMEEEYIKKSTNKGMFLDIFPLDGLPDDKESAIKWGNKVGLWARLIGYHSNSFPRLTSIKNLLKFPVIGIARLFPESYLIRKVDSLAKRFPFAQSVYCAKIVNRAYPIEREMHLSEDYSSRLLAPFESTELYIPYGYDRILKTLYGDYMTPPPIGQQQSHHGVSVIWKDKRNS